MAAAVVPTIAAAQFFSWGLFLAGRRLELHWNYMTPAQFSALQTIFEADAAVVFRPGTGPHYNVQLMDLAGEYHINLTGAVSAQDVIGVLRYLFAVRGTPVHLRSDNGPEFVGRALDTWAYEHKVTLDFIQPFHQLRPILSSAGRRCHTQ